LHGAAPAEIESAGAIGAGPASGARSGRPAWLDHDAPSDLAAERSISPSRAEDGSGPVGAAGGSGDRIKALARGTLVHRLLQSLPGIPPEQRAEAARRHLAGAAALFSAPERDSMIDQVRIVLEDARFGDLFGAGSRAEVPIVGRITLPGAAGGRTMAVSGQVDRLAVTPTGVLIADYKTNRPAPRRPEDVPAAYVKQLALYRAVLRLIYPDRPVRAALVWTDVPDLMEVSADTLDRALTSP
jgi:ATP-dependent helicase/nuclease subunit A